MVLNDTTNLVGLLQDIYFNGKINSSTFPANDILRIVNKYYKMAQSEIRAINEDFYGEIYRANLQINTGGTYPNEYLLPTDYEKIKQIQVAYSPVDPTNPLDTEFVVVDLIGQGQISAPNYVFSSPTAVLFDNSFFLYPVPTVAVTNGIKLYGIKTQPDLANATDTPNIFTDYQDVITWGSLIDIAVRKGDSDLFNKATSLYSARTASMKKDASGRAINLGGAYVEGQALGGWEFPFGNNSMS